MSYTVTFDGRKLYYRRTSDSHEYFTRIYNGTGIDIPKEYMVDRGLFFKVVRIILNKGELFFGYFTTDPSTFFYGMSGFWKAGVLLLISPSAWMFRAVEELGMDKVRPGRKADAHAERLARFVRHVCENHIC